MQKVLFICHGNICRSPAAEIIFNSLCKQEKVDALAESRATSSEEIWNGVGNPVYPPMRAELERRGYSCGNKRAELLRKEDYQKFDYLIGMDDMNIRNMRKLFNGDSSGKIKRLMDYTEHPGEVPDPWYTGEFHSAADSIEQGCRELIRVLKERETGR